MKPSPVLALVLGLWIGSTASVLAVVGYSFQAIDRSLSVREDMAKRVGYDEENPRLNPLWVHTGELNRAIFHGWNRAQLALAALALLIALARCPRPGVIFPLMAAAVIVLVLTFYLGPEVTDLGRRLDFVPRDSPESGDDFARFDVLHRTYSIAEGVKTLLLIAAAFLASRASGAAIRSPDDPEPGGVRKESP